MPRRALAARRTPLSWWSLEQIEPAGEGRTLDADRSLVAALARVKALARLEAADATERGDVVGAAVLGALAARVEEELGPRRRTLEERERPRPEEVPRA